MEIKNVKVAFLNEAIYRSGYPMQVGEPEDLDMPDLLSICDGDIKRAKKLAKVPTGSGHDNFLKGIIVQFDLKYTQYITKQLQRYNWFEYISSQSIMHRITKIDDIKLHCNKYVLEDIACTVDVLIDVYNKEEFPYILKQEYAADINIYNKEECYYYIISNIPMGYELWTGVTTSYLQLKTIYQQRKKHKLKYDWQYFCNWVKTLPMAKELILNE